MKKRLLLFLLLLLFIPISKTKALDLSCQTHVRFKGWLNNVGNNKICGTTGEGLRMEAIKLKLDNLDYEGSIVYRTHVQYKGWMNEVSDGEMSGTTGQGLRMEGIIIYLTGELADHYTIYYRAHIQYKGWLPWVEEGELGGTTGEGLRMEALQIKLVSKDDLNASINYSVHNSEGWQENIKDGEMAGSTGKGLKIDMLKINVDNYTTLKGNVEYQTYLTPTGWTNKSINNEQSGQKDKTIEAIKINLTGELAEKFNIYYRVHVRYLGWLDWASNGDIAGTIGYFYRIEAVEIKMQPKDSSNVVTEKNSYYESNNSVSYSSHVEYIGWQDYVKDGELSGTTGQSKRIEAIKIKLDTKLGGSISYNTYITKRGWSNNSVNNSISGTTGLGRTLEGISVKLTGEISEYYDVYYRTHMSHVGWLSWTKNGEKSGALNSGSKLEAIQIKLVKKGLPFNEDTSRPLVSGSWKNNKYYDYFGNLSTGFKVIDGTKYYFNPEGKQYGKNVQKVIDVSSWQESINWDLIKKLEDVDAAIIRVGWGTSYNDPCGTDSYLDRNIKEVQRLGIPYGIYIYAYAETTAAAEKEANFVISKMKQYNMPKNTYVWYDAEIGSISRSTYNTVIPAFVNKIKANGYNNVGVYSGVRQLDTTNGNTNTPTIRSYPIWVSQYYKDLQYTGTYKGWQYASDERIDGINGNVDVSMFKK